ncbi:MAG: hypothetical protein M1834_000540 [Cirrosporium novae-zelandiae]|nr:MAG: hypothetical protein M1834_000540 [Cirrosporium novae-zelandiae]
MMPRRLVRTATQLGFLLFILVCFLILVDNRLDVLPESMHSYLPAHHPGLVVTDITVVSCSSINLLSKCQLDPDKWHRIEKELYLGSGWLKKAYVHVQRKMEADLSPDDKIILDVRVGRLDPAMGEKGQANEKWESRPGGLWLKRSAKKHSSESQKVITSVDVLFGADAVEPRTGWEIRDTPLLLDMSNGQHDARLSVRRGTPAKIEKHIPRIRKDGKFKIMQVADIHLSTGLGACRDAEPPGHNGGKCDADPRTLEFIARLLDQEKPDFVVLTGDQVNGDTAPDGQSAIFKYAELFIKRGIPYASIFGNHDDEGSLSRAGQMALVESLPYSVSEAGPKDVEGVGNYYVEVLAPGTSTHSALTLYMLDTHAYSPDENHFRGYDWIKPNQIDWFHKTAQGLKGAHDLYTHVHMDLAFIHIPLPEYREPNNLIVGQWREPPTAPGFNSHFHDALVDEGVLMVSCGHDHVNDYCMLSRSPEQDKPQLWMCYGGGAGFGGYGGYGGYHRRVRFFGIDTNEARISTWKRLEYGETEKRIDEQVIVEGGRVVAG